MKRLHLARTTKSEREQVQTQGHGLSMETGRVHLENCPNGGGGEGGGAKGGIWILRGS